MLSSATWLLFSSKFMFEVVLVTEFYTVVSLSNPSLHLYLGLRPAMSTTNRVLFMNIKKKPEKKNRNMFHPSFYHIGLVPGIRQYRSILLPYQWDILVILAIGAWPTCCSDTLFGFMKKPISNITIQFQESVLPGWGGC